MMNLFKDVEMKQQLLPITDNIMEVLVMILDFTNSRHKTLIENLNNVNTEDYVPYDLDVDGFAETIEQALTAHIVSGRLALVDSENICFNSEGNFNVVAVEDKIAKQLFDNDIEKYLEHQKRKLSENAINSRLAAELLRRKQTIS